jgi:hypothetical protein
MKKALHTLQSLRTKYEVAALAEKRQLLKSRLITANATAKELFELHELLLFIRAYPDNEEILRLAEQCQEKCNNAIQRILRKRSSSTQRIFENTGIIGTTITGCFSYDLVSWLHHQYPTAICFDSFGGDVEEVYAHLLSLLPASIREHYTDHGYTTAEEWLQTSASHNRYDQLKLILSLFSSEQLHFRQRDALFDRLQLYVEIDTTRVPCRSNNSIPRPAVYYHEQGLIRKTDLNTILQEALPEEKNLSHEEKQQYIASIRLQLLSLYRETDPGTYADINDLHVYHVGRGMEIVLQGMQPERRNPIDAYIGFMAFKNGLPYAYGGAWLLGKMAKIGINVFPSFRGGESAWFFAQLKRVYYQQFNPAYFVAEPYQIGRDNPEGIETGAFWFYYRLGYRPMQNKLQQLAAEHWKKMLAQPGKKSPVKILLQLVEDEMVYLPSGNESALKQKFDTAGLSHAITSHIRKRYKGDIGRFMAHSKACLLTSGILPALKADKINAIEQLSQYLFIEDDLIQFTVDERKSITALLIEKTIGSDCHYARLLSENKKMQEILYRLYRMK